ncbi:hypothetical protein SK128_014294, partial [Halocaridina rubra]
MSMGRNLRAARCLDFTDKDDDDGLYQPSDSDSEGAKKKGTYSLRTCSKYKCMDCFPPPKSSSRKQFCTQTVLCVPSGLFSARSLAAIHQLSI